MISPVDLYLNADRTKVVTEGPDAASLLVNAGRDIPDAEVAAMGPGILEQAQKLAAPAEQASSAKPEEPEAKEADKSEDKAVKAPEENKGHK